MAYLADVNFLIALLHAGHVHSPQAVEWLDRQDEPASILLCRVAQMGVLRISTNPRLMKEDVQSAAAVWGAWDLLLTDDRFVQVEEPRTLEMEWRRLTSDLPLGSWAETDSYFAAFACAGDYRLLTFEKKGYDYPDLDVERLGTP